MGSYPLAETRTVTLDSRGSAVALGVGPVKYGETWTIKRISVNTTSRCKFTAHRGYGTDRSTQIDGTVRGDLDTSETSIRLQSGEQISFAWSGGQSGAVGVVRIEGDRELVGR